jgi:hypothetical protein
MLVHSDPKAAGELLVEAQEDVRTRWRMYEHMAAMKVSPIEALSHANQIRSKQTQATQ